MQVLTAEIENIFSLVAPTSLDPSQLAHLADMVESVRLCTDLRIDRRVLLKLVMDSSESIRHSLRSPAYTEIQISAMTQLAQDIRYALYQATMSALEQKPFDLRQWQASSGFINDKPEKRQPASSRWRELLRVGLRIGDHVTTGSPTISGRLTTIEADCMVTLAKGGTIARTSPRSLKPISHQIWNDKN